MKLIATIAIIACFFGCLNCKIISPLCLACHQIVQFVQESAPLRPTVKIANEIGTKYCEQKHLQANNVCRGAVTAMTEFIINSLWLHYTDPHLVCSKVKFCSKQYKMRNLTKEVEQILASNPKKTWETPSKRKTLKIMHISDLHPDLYYTVGANTNCSQPVCCRGNVTSSNQPLYQRLKQHEEGNVLSVNDGKLNANETAGYWGSLSNCDLPYQTLDLFLKELSKMKLDLIIWTGDNTAHDIWAQSQDYNLNYTFSIVEKMRKATNTRIIPAMGNHESWPVNVYDFERTREQVLNGGLANAWRQWLDEEAYEELSKNGFYSIELPEINNLKIISLNTQADNNQNWFLLRDPTDPGSMLKWIEKELKESEQKSQFVYIMGHIPPKGLNEWSVRFNALVQRYSYIIRGQFYGHSHSDHIGFFRSFEDKTKLSSFYFLPPSLTTFSNKNSNYRVMTVDYDSLQVLNYEQYMLDLKRYTKKEQDAKYELLYSFKELYKLDDMTVQGGITQFYHKMQNDPYTQQLYTSVMKGGRGKGTSGRNVFCQTLTTPQFIAQCMGKKFQNSKFQKAAGPWKTLNHKQNSQ